MALTLETLNLASTEQFVDLLEGVYLDAPWITESAAKQRPFSSLAQLKLALVEPLSAASDTASLALIGAQADAAMNALSTIAAQDTDDPTLAQQLTELSEQYQTQFSLPFILAACGASGAGLRAAEVVATLRRRLDNPLDYERAEALREIHRIAASRLNEKLDLQPAMGMQVWDWAQALANHSDPGFKERGELAVTYLTQAHQACSQQLQTWMHDCGFDEVHIDAVGSVVGVYHGATKTAKRLLVGSHFDTVRNGGKFDGRLGIMVPMVAVKELARTNKRLSAGIEVVGFAEEEGQRFKTSFLCSSALVGQFDFDVLDRTDADGITMRDAMNAVGLQIADIAALERDPSNYHGYVELHVEQGPVLSDAQIPLGVVTSINGHVRYFCEITGLAGHAGTTPMAGRRDAANAAAEILLYVEQRASETPGVVATAGMLEVPGGSVNVIPGRCTFSLDIRTLDDRTRQLCADDILRAIERICARRRVRYTAEKVSATPSALSNQAMQQRWQRAVESIGLPVFAMPSGAGHDAMKMHLTFPQAMLFVRGLHAGVSHNPLECSSTDDIDLAAQAFLNLAERFGSD